MSESDMQDRLSGGKRERPVIASGETAPMSEQEVKPLTRRAAGADEYRLGEPDAPDIADRNVAPYRLRAGGEGVRLEPYGDTHSRAQHGVFAYALDGSARGTVSVCCALGPHFLEALRFLAHPFMLANWAE